jgi:hypothetical protein
MDVLRATVATACSSLLVTRSFSFLALFISPLALRRRRLSSPLTPSSPGKRTYDDVTAFVVARAADYRKLRASQAPAAAAAPAPAAAAPAAVPAPAAAAAAAGAAQ